MTKRYKFALLLFACTLFSGLHAQKQTAQPALYQRADAARMQIWVDSVFNTLTPEERVGQLFTLITYGDEAHRKEILSQVENQSIGGIIFLKGAPLIQANLTNAAQKKAKVPLMISIDGEWGLAMRLAGTTRFPKNMMLGAIQNDSLLYLYGREMARQCRLMGIHVNFAPDIDTNTNPDNPVIGIRAYGESPELVSRKGIMYAKGLEDGNVLSVAKHFPGHGNTSTDSHYTLPLVSGSRERLNQYELVPFRDYIDAGLGGMMVAHLNIPALDTIKQPASLSSKVATEVLQDSLGFKGLIFTDGLTMQGVTVEKEHCVRALQAGNDILLGPVNLIKQYESVKKAVKDGDLSDSLIDIKCRKVLEYKYLLNITKTPIPVDSLLANLNTDYADWINRKLNQKAMTLLKNNDDIIPLKKLDERKIVAVSIGAPAGNSFHKTLKKYGTVPCYSAADAAALTKLKPTLDKYNTVIISIHSTKANVNDAIAKVCKGKKTILTFFTTPYRMAPYKTAIEQADGLVLAYEDTPLAREYAAQAIFGGVEMDARIPVSVKGLFKAGDGMDTPKTRLGYSMPEEVGMLSTRLKELEKIAEEGIENEAYPGCQILVAKDGYVIYEQTFGTFRYGDSTEMVTNESIYDLASMTKAVATLPAVMKLYDKKKITLNSALSTYVPILKGTDKAKITVRQALLHESRMPSFIPYYVNAIDTASYKGRLFSRSKTPTHKVQFDGTTWANPAFKYKKHLVSNDSLKNFVPLADNLFINQAYRDTILATIAKTPLRRRAGSMYSCLNFMLLKEMVEEQSGEDLNTYLQKNFYEPLGMDMTTYNPLTRFGKSQIVPTENDRFLRKQIVRGYVHDEGAAYMGGISGNAGLFSDANDIAKLCQLLLNSGSYGDEEYLSKNTCNLFTKTRSAISRRGLGFDKPETRTNKLNPCAPSAPASVYGHTGFTGTCFWIDPDNQLIFIFLSNRVYPSRTHTKLMKLSIRQRIQEEIYQAMKVGMNS
ncbi:glycoside hydrolase family 3 N-terminal domain-containing protein [Dysgonomonas sp. 25]|uniref:glycoside hydrolase family 3 N-terminal domain-containing protein n=1 Tax=Dysgonomonas sp. 25 TaxID=2302933 RepID=UPI0013CF979A|nr:glycoside hydrolase family 3 N-terminal domain-containing protein [Dysgonomonas sp. 25]NDV68034.1 glycoside hydrolase [Dysgonomonas sp. 25]